MFNGIMGGFYRITTWIAKLAYINILWILFTCLGLGVFGIFPATVAVFAISRRLIRRDPDFSIFQEFWSQYKTEFIKSNMLGFVVTTIGVVLYLDINFVSRTDSFLQYAYYPLLAITLFFLLSLLYVFPVFSHYNVNIFFVIRNAFIVMIVHPFATIIMAGGTIAIYLFMRSIPGLIPFFTISLWSLMIVTFTHRIFQGLDEQQKKADEQ